METINIRISQIDGSDKAGELTAELDTTVGVELSMINFGGDTGKIVYDPSLILSEDLLNIIREFGFEAQIVTDDE